MKHTMASVTTHVKDKYPQFVYIAFSDVFVVGNARSEEWNMSDSVLT